jgi:hypothetical protein
MSLVVRNVMKFAFSSRVASSAVPLVVGCTCTLVLFGCGGATYSLGSLPEDGGPVDGASSPSSCSSATGPGLVGMACDAGNPTLKNGTGAPDASTFVAADAAGCPLGKTCNGGIPTPVDASATTSACTPASLSCPTGATGYACTAGNDPANEQANLACSSGTINGYAIDYCCFPWPAGTGCAPYAGFPCGANSYAFQCKPGTLPSSINVSLSCGTSFVDANGDNDFCCTYS